MKWRFTLLFLEQHHNVQDCVEINHSIHSSKQTWEHQAEENDRCAVCKGGMYNTSCSRILVSLLQTTVFFFFLLTVWNFGKILAIQKKKKKTSGDLVSVVRTMCSSKVTTLTKPESDLSQWPKKRWWCKVFLQMQVYKESYNTRFTNDNWITQQFRLLTSVNH